MQQKLSQHKKLKQDSRQLSRWGGLIGEVGRVSGGRWLLGLGIVYFVTTLLLVPRGLEGAWVWENYHISACHQLSCNSCELCSFQQLSWKKHLMSSASRKYSFINRDGRVAALVLLLA